ncbi:MAG: hypothetical protein AAGJ31_15475 [Verrucomicrobiota bacterium]
MKRCLLGLVLLSGLLGSCGKKEAPPLPPPPGKETPSPSTKSSSPPAPAAKVAESVPKKPEPKSELDRRVERQYPLPKYQPLEDLVKNWTVVPQTVINAVGKVTVTVPTEYKLMVDGKAIGSRKADAGHQAKLLKFKPGQLLVSSSDEKMKAVIRVEDSDFQDQVRALYETQVKKGEEKVLAARRAAKAALLAAQKAGGGGSIDFGSASSDPRFQPVVSYLKAGKLKAGTLEEAKAWLWVGPESHRGTSYDVVLVNFEVSTIFGVFPNALKALLQGGRVIGWVDADTGEPRD